MLAARLFQDRLSPSRPLSLATHGTVSAGSCLLWLHKWGITPVSSQLGQRDCSE